MPMPEHLKKPKDRIKAKRCKPKGKKKLPSKTTVRNRMDAKWSKIVRSVGFCEYCKASNAQLHAHHIIGIRNLDTRWNLKNGICLCANHHTVSSTFSAHETPEKFREWLIEYSGKERLDLLKIESRKGTKFTIHDYLEIDSDLKGAGLI